MKTIQVASILNTMTGQVLGDSAIQTIDLSNIVDIGAQVEAMTADQFTNFITGTVDHIGRMVFVNRRYTANAPDILRDGWEYGSILEKISTVLPDAEENESWELVDGASYDPNIYTAPKIIAKYYDKQVTFEITMPSRTRKQLLSAFSDATQLNAYFSMLYTAIENSMSVKLESLTMSLISNAIGETVYDDTKTTAVEEGKTYAKTVNLLQLFKTEVDPATTLTPETALSDITFLRFSTQIINRYMRLLGKMSTQYNIGKQARFTPRDKMHIVLLGNYVDAVDSVLQSQTFHNELTALPYYDVVPFWQSAKSVDGVNIRTASGQTVNQSGVIGCIFDHDALAICCEDRRVTTNYNPRGEFINEWHKADARYLMDTNENIVVFTVGAVAGA